jgi:hypothetical protein
MSGQPVGRLVADAAKKQGWEPLNAAYSAQLGIASTGWPENAPANRGGAPASESGNARFF